MNATIKNDRGEVSCSTRATSNDLTVKRNTNGVEVEIRIHGFNNSEIEYINNQVDDFYATHKGRSALLEAIF